MSREQSTRRPKCPATGKVCNGSHPLQCYGGTACLKEEQEARRKATRCNTVDCLNTCTPDERLCNL